MTISKRITVTAAIGVIALGAVACESGASAGAGNYPNRNIQVVVPYPAGSGTDTTARALVEIVNKKGDLGKRLQVINKEGGAGTIGTTSFLNAKPDGYTISFMPDGPLTLTPHVEKVSYNRKDSVPLVAAVNSTTMLVVPKNSPYKTTQDLVDAAKARPSKISLAEGPLNYFVPATMFEKESGTTFKRVKYDGDQAASTALLGNNVDVAVMQLAGALPLLKSGKVRALGITSPDPVALAPEVPTFASQGWDVSWSATYTVAVNKQVPDAIQDKLAKVFTAAIKSPEFGDVSKKLGLELSGVDTAAATKILSDKFEASAEILETSK